MKSVISYLRTNFLSESDFLIQNTCSYEDLSRWQKNNIFPEASYKTDKACKTTSFFGIFEFSDVEKWYPKGLREWVLQIKNADEDPSVLKDIFFKRYKLKINELFFSGLSDQIYNNEENFSVLLEDEWRHFLNGTYGVCTRDCSPEQIATKDITIRVIDRITEKQQKKSISEDEKNFFVISVNLLDAVSSSFSPHERERSSRKRCIEFVREKYSDITI